MTRAQLKKIIEEEIIKEFGGVASRLASAGIAYSQGNAPDAPGKRKVKKTPKKKPDCFDRKDFDSKSQCIQTTQKKSEESADAIVAKVLRDEGEIE